MTEPLAYREGRFLPQSQAGLALHDAGFVQAVTVTDLARTFRLRLFRWEDHLVRFRQSCRLAQVPLLADDGTLTAAALDLVDHNGRLLDPGQELCLVLFATPGPLGWYSNAPGPASPTLGLYTFPLPFARYAPLFRDGATLLIPAMRHLPAAMIDRRIKHRSRLFWWLAENEVRGRDPAASALLLDDDGTVTETAAANLLLVRGGVVRTPPAGQVLGGVSLGVVRELCGGLGIPFEESVLTPGDCFDADEALLSCTSFCLAPVGRLDEREMPPDRPIFERLLAAWSDHVGVDIRGQFLGG